MKKLAVAIFLIVCFFSWTGTALASQNKALILEDEIHASGPGSNPENTIANLLGHFNLPYEIKTVDSYVKGDVDSYRVTFYVGDYWDHTLPADFLEDVLTTDSRVVWVNYNLWQLAWGTGQQEFETRFGFRYVQTRPTGKYTRVAYKGRTFSRSQGEFAQLQILDTGKALQEASFTGGSTTYPFVVKSGNFWFVADEPILQYTGDSSYLVWCDLLHDMVDLQHPAEHKALVRIEDIDAYEDPAKVRAIADYLNSQGVPFSLGVIPRFTDPLGVLGPPSTIDIDTKPELISALRYAISKGGTVVLHGYTHQYDTVANPTNGLTGEDAEFYIESIDGGGNLIYVSPVPEDSVSWVQDRIDNGRAIFTRAGLPQPQIWETPHYIASDLDYQVFGSNFSAVYQSFDNFFPYPLHRTVYGSPLIPENLGYISPPGLTSQMVINLADKNLGIRDGYASFFFHPEVDINNLKVAVEGIKGLGYTFIDPGSLTWADPPDETPPVVSAVSPAGDIHDAQAQISVQYSDTGSGIDTAAVPVELDGGSLSGCNVTETGAICQVTGLQIGPHTVSGSVADKTGNSTSFSVGFTVIDDVAPAIMYSSPSGTLTSGDLTVSATYSDPEPSSGIAVATLSLNAGTPLPCDATGGLVSCPVSGLPDDHYDAVVTLTDNYGNQATASGSFLVDTTGPDVISFSPQGVIQVTDLDMVANFVDGGSGINTSSVEVTLDGTVMDCWVSTTYLKCSVFGLGDGAHDVNVRVSDVAGNSTTKNFSFSVVTCASVQPCLEMTLESIYWATFRDYISRTLSVDFNIVNTTGPDAFKVLVTSVASTNGAVVHRMPGPGDIPTSGSLLITIGYGVPSGISTFQTHISVSAQDACGNAFSYGE